LVDEQHATTLAIELSCEIGDAVALKIEVVHVDVQALLVEYIEMLFGVLQEESGLADTARTLNADHTAVPINLIHKAATYWGIGMLYKVSMRPEKCFHPV